MTEESEMYRNSIDKLILYKWLMIIVSDDLLSLMNGIGAYMENFNLRKKRLKLIYLRMAFLCVCYLLMI